MLSSCSDSKPTNTPVQPARAISRTRDGSSVTSMVDGSAPDLLQRSQRPAQAAQVVGPRAKVVVDEHGVGLVVGTELLDDLLHVAHQVGHLQPVGGQVTETAAVVTAARGNQAGRGEEAVARQQVAARRRVVAVGPPVAAVIDGLQGSQPPRRAGPGPRRGRPHR